MPYGILHVEFCWDYELEVSYQMFSNATLQYNWVLPDPIPEQAVVIPAGDYSLVTYDYSLTVYANITSFVLFGLVRIYNPDPVYPASICSLSDMLTAKFGVVTSCSTVKFCCINV